MFIEYNPNPVGRYDVGDCAIRAISKALGETWEDSYLRLCVAGFMMGDLPNSDSVFGAILRQNGFKRKSIPDTCPDCYTVEDFAIDHPRGIFVLGLGGHVVTIVDGDIYDMTNSSKGIPVYYWYKDEITQERDNGATERDVLLSTPTPISTASAGTTNAVPADCATAAKPATAK